jgi:hypothetical protein
VLNHYTGWKIAVQSAHEGGCYIVAPNPQVDAICRLLAENGVAHAVEDSCIRLEGMNLEKLIRIESGNHWDSVQELLDADGIDCAVPSESGQVWYW